MDEASAKGFQLLEQGDFEGALASFKIGVEASNSVDALLGRGCANFGLGKFEDALVDFRSALNIDSENAEAHYRLGLSIRHDEPNEYGHQKAIERFTASIGNGAKIRGFPGDRGKALLLVERGVSHVALENNKAGEEDYNEAVALTPGWWLPHFGRGIQRGAVRDHDGAASDFLEMLKDADWDRRYLETLLTELSNLKVYSPQGTLRVYKALLPEFGHLTSVQRGIAFCFEKTGDHEEAVAWAERSLAQQPHNYSQEIAARSHTALGEYYQALDHWNALIESRPDYAYAINMRDQLLDSMANRGLKAESEVEDEASLHDLKKAELVELVGQLADILVSSPSRMDSLHDPDDVLAFLRELKALGESARRGQIWRPDSS